MIWFLVSLKVMVPRPTLSLPMLVCFIPNKLCAKKLLAFSFFDVCFNHLMGIRQCIEFANYSEYLTTLFCFSKISYNAKQYEIGNPK